VRLTVVAAAGRDEEGDRARGTTADVAAVADGAGDTFAGGSPAFRQGRDRSFCCNMLAPNQNSQAESMLQNFFFFLRCDR